VITTEAWFILFLITELPCVGQLQLSINIISLVFFPFIHWYEILAIIPHLRFLRLFRAGIIAYRLHELGYKSFLRAGPIKGCFIITW
jgi:hypothetical protein